MVLFWFSKSGFDDVVGGVCRLWESSGWGLAGLLLRLLPASMVAVSQHDVGLCGGGGFRGGCDGGRFGGGSGRGGRFGGGGGRGGYHDEGPPAEVDWIIQYDPPDDPKEYVHRVGRTARGEGSKGNALLFLTPEELQFLSHLKISSLTKENKILVKQLHQKISRPVNISHNTNKENHHLTTAISTRESKDMTEFSSTATKIQSCL